MNEKKEIKLKENKKNDSLKNEEENKKNNSFKSKKEPKEKILQKQKNFNEVELSWFASIII